MRTVYANTYRRAVGCDCAGTYTEETVTLIPRVSADDTPVHSHAAAHETRGTRLTARAGVRTLSPTVDATGDQGTRGPLVVRVDDGAANAQPGVTALGPAPSERANREHALVLQSMGIWHAARRAGFGWVLLVRDEDAARAADGIARYEAENQNWPPPRRRERLPYRGSVAALVVVALLTAFFCVTGPDTFTSHFGYVGAADADLLLTREPWRAVTTLTLHGDVHHILGNAISGAIFGTAVNRRLGGGVGMLAILASGIFGNVFNSLWHVSSDDAFHSSIGASTAIFGAVGILAATQIAVDDVARARGEKRTWVDLAAPAIGGLALLGALGSGGEHTDLGAHLYGLLSGFIVGLVASGVILFRARRATPTFVREPGQRFAAESVSLGSPRPNLVAQAIAGSLAIVIVMLSWVMAFTHA
jgi:membrane associated rhomboid family serine protease